MSRGQFLLKINIFFATPSFFERGNRAFSRPTSVCFVPSWAGRRCGTDIRDNSGFLPNRNGKRTCTGPWRQFVTDKTEQWNSPPQSSFWKSVKHRNVSWLYSRPSCFFVILLLYMSKVKTGCCFVNSIRFGYWQVRTSSSPRWTNTWCR